MISPNSEPVQPVDVAMGHGVLVVARANDPEPWTRGPEIQSRTFTAEEVAGIDADQRQLRLADGQHVEYEYLVLGDVTELDLSSLASLGDRLVPANEPAMSRGIAAAAARGVLGAGCRVVIIAESDRIASLVADVERRLNHGADRAEILPIVVPAARRDGSHGEEEAMRTALDEHGYRARTGHAAGLPGAVLLDDGSVIEADLVVATGPWRLPHWLRVSRLSLDSDGFVVADASGRSRSHPEVWVSGIIRAPLRRSKHETSMPSHPRTARLGQAAIIALVVGSVVNAINLGPAWVSGTRVSLVSAVLNYVVPFAVATFSGMLARSGSMERADG